MKSNKSYIIFNIVIIVILLSLGTYGFINKDNTFKAKENTSTPQKKESNVLTEDNKTYMKNITISLFNDSFKYLTFKQDGNIIISDEARLTSAAKTLYLNGELDTTKALNKNEQSLVVDKVAEIYNTSTEFKEITINYSNDYCGVDNYNSKKGLINSKDKTASGKCKLPFMMFEIGKINKTSENAYTLIVYNAFVQTEDITADNTCKSNEDSYSKILKGYSDHNFKNNIYNSKVVGCCPKGSCETAAIYNEKDKVMNIAKDSDSYYEVTFEKKKDVFELTSIIKNK